MARSGRSGGIEGLPIREWSAAKPASSLDVASFTVVRIARSECFGGIRLSEATWPSSDPAHAISAI